MVKINNGRLELCSGINIDIYKNEAIKIGEKLHELFKEYTNTLIETHFKIESSINSTNFRPTYFYNLMIHEDSFIIEVNIILYQAIAYKFEMRWEEKG